jgi:hypothetical protein
VVLVALLLAWLTGEDAADKEGPLLPMLIVTDDPGSVVTRLLELSDGLLKISEKGSISLGREVSEG